MRGLFAALLALGSVVLGSSVAFGQNLPDVAPLGGGPPPTQSAPSKAPPGAPETHAASGGDSLLPQSSEPTLPDDPTAMTDATRAMIGADADPESHGTSNTNFRFYGLYSSETGPDYSYRVLFPLWGERRQPSLDKPEILDRASLYGGLYYQRRSAAAEDDVLFPLVWNLQNPLEKSRSTIVGPFVNRRTPTESDDWFAPLYMTGRRPGGGYTIVPPLLTALHSEADKGLSILGPAFCSWTGGPSCDTRTARDLDLGIVPLYFFGQNEDRIYEVIPPLLHYYSYRERTRSYTNIFGPYYREHTEKREMFHLLPLYYSVWGPKERHTTLLPFFHLGHNEETKERLFVNPLYLTREGSDGDKTFVTWLYARHRGATELDMVSPLYWEYRDPRIDVRRKLFFPFLYSNLTPREQTTVVFPFYGYSERYGISKSLWITPAFNYTESVQGWSLNVLPSIFLAKDANSSHTVVAPLFFDFASPKGRTTFGLPFFFRGTDLENTTQVVGNLYYRERRFKNGRDWEFHVLPLFSYGESPDGHFWNVLFGLTGFTRAGTRATVRAFWLPFNLSE